MRKAILFFLLLFPFQVNAALVNNESNVLVLSDIHVNSTSTRTMDISPSTASIDNDLDTPSLEKLMSAINENIKNGVLSFPNMIVILGDIAGHTRDSYEGAANNEAILFRTLKKHFPSTPIFYTFGNNDSLKQNYGPFKDKDRIDHAKSPYDIAKLNGWVNGFLSTGEHCTNRQHPYPCLITEDNVNGYYSAYLEPKLRFISLNSALFSPKRQHVNEQEAMEQLSWLKDQLTLSNTYQESVLIAMHIPPGNDLYDNAPLWLPKEQAIFLDLIKMYKSIIMGLLASHTHLEELKIIQGDDKHTVSGIYFTASLSTAHGNAPSVKTFYLSKKKAKWQLANYDTFHFSMNRNTLTLNKLYSYNDYYCDDQENDLSQCLDNVTAEKMQTYLNAGNPNYEIAIKSPTAIYLQ